MTNKVKDVYINNTCVVAGPYLYNGPLSGKFDLVYKDYYDGESTFEKCEIKELKKCISYIIRKEDLKIEDINLLLSSDLTNQLMVSNMVAKDFDIPYFGLYNACSSFTEQLIIGSLAINSNIKRVLCTTSGHSNTSERQFRNPIEYGCPKPEYATFTTSAATACILSKEKKGVKIESYTIGKVIDLGIKDAFDMGSAMAPAAANTLYEHLNETKRDPNYYDLILTGDLGKYGKRVFEEYYKKEYHHNLDNYNDSATLVYDMNNKKVLAGGSGPSCLPSFLFSEVFKNMNEKKIKKILILATGALHSTTSINTKESIPCISHAVSLEVL